MYRLVVCLYKMAIDNDRRQMGVGAIIVQSMNGAV